MRIAATTLVAVVILAGCDRFMPASRAAEQSPTGAGLPAAPTRAPGDALLQPAAASARLHGGRPIAWWNSRLGELQHQGTPELYRLTLQRAKAAGLLVVEGPPLTVSEAEVAR